MRILRRWKVYYIICIEVRTEVTERALEGLLTTVTAAAIGAREDAGPDLVATREEALITIPESTPPPRLMGLLLHTTVIYSRRTPVGEAEGGAAAQGSSTGLITPRTLREVMPRNSQMWRWELPGAPEAEGMPLEPDTPAAVEAGEVSREEGHFPSRALLTRGKEVAPLQWCLVSSSSRGLARKANPATSGTSSLQSKMSSESQCGTSLPSSNRPRRAGASWQSNSLVGSPLILDSDQQIKLVTASRNGAICIWNHETAQAEAMIDVGGTIGSLIYADGHFLCGVLASSSVK